MCSERPIEGRPALIVDDVFDSGRTIAYARAHLAAKGATQTLACAFVRKPQAVGEAIDAIGWDAPSDFLIGYGMDERVLAAVKQAKFIPQRNKRGLNESAWTEIKFQLEIPQ